MPTPVRRPSSPRRCSTCSAKIARQGSAARCGSSFLDRSVSRGRLPARRSARRFPLLDRLQLGRSPDADLCLRQGGHSDENTVARRHAVVERTVDGVRACDLSSTRGTFLRGQKIAAAPLLPGEELAIAGTHRVRLDGSFPDP